MPAFSRPKQNFQSDYPDENEPSKPGQLAYIVSACIVSAAPKLDDDLRDGTEAYSHLHFIEMTNQVNMTVFGTQFSYQRRIRITDSFLKNRSLVPDESLQQGQNASYTYSAHRHPETPENEGLE